MDQIDLLHNPNMKVKSKVIQKQSDDFGRKRWQVEHYQQLQGPKQQTAQSREQKYLIARTQKLQLQKNHRKDGFYCQVCNQLFKCDIAYLTHINSQFHNRKLGMSLKVEASSVQDVKSKLSKLSKVQPISKVRQKINEKKTRMENIIKAQLENAIKINTKPKDDDSDQQSDDINHSNQDQDEQQLQNDDEDVEQQQVEVKVIQTMKPIQTPIEPQEQKPQIKPVQDIVQQPQQDPQEEMMKALGLPTKFKSKKR